MCGSSNVFSAIGALEGARAQAYGNLVKLSEQNIIDCSGEQNSLNIYLNIYYLSIVAHGNRGCKGGNMYDAHLYIIANEGIDTESSYKYQGQVGSI